MIVGVVVFIGSVVVVFIGSDIRIRVRFHHVI